MFRLKFFSFLFSCIFTTSIVTADESGSVIIPPNQVLIQFDLVQTEDWTETVLNEFKKKIAEYVTSFCQKNKTICKIQSVQFNSNNVLITSGYPKVKDVNSLMLFQVNFPPSVSDDSGSKTLNQLALIAVVTENREQLQADLLAAAHEPYEASFRISYVNHVLVLQTVDQTLNNIIIPIVCSIVLVMTIIILGLEAIKRKKMKAQVKKLEQKYGKSEPLLKN